MINDCNHCKKQETCPDKDNVYCTECPMYISDNWGNIQPNVSDDLFIDAEADYENRLKADLEAILVELQLEIEKEKKEVSSMAMVGGLSIAKTIIQQKINELKAESEPQESEVENGN